MTPPVAPKMTAAPVLAPRGLSKRLLQGVQRDEMVACGCMRTNSRVVRTTSTSGSPQASFMVLAGRTRSFLAMQGMTEMTCILWGSMPNLLGEVALGHGAEHLLGGFGGGEVVGDTPGTGTLQTGPSRGSRR